MMGPFRLRGILEASPAQQEAVRALRNHPDVRSAMYADHVISPEEHAGWLLSLVGNGSREVFVLLDDEGEVAGLVSLTAIDRANGRADWGFYMSPEAPKGLGSAALCRLIEFSFGELGLHKINGEVIEGNAASLAVHRKLLFREEGFRRAQVLRKENRLGVHLFGLTREDWLSGRGTLRPASHRIELEAGA